MEYTEHTAGNRLEISLSGRFTFADHKAFRTVIAKIETAAAGQVRFDLSDLSYIDSSYIDSAALGMLLLARDSTVAKGKQISLRGVGEQVQRVMKVAHFDRLFTIEP